MNSSPVKKGAVFGLLGLHAPEVVLEVYVIQSYFRKMTVESLYAPSEDSISDEIVFGVGCDDREAVPLTGAVSAVFRIEQDPGVFLPEHAPQTVAVWVARPRAPPAGAPALRRKPWRPPG